MAREHEHIRIGNLTKEIARSKAMAKVRGPFQETCTACGGRFWPHEREDHSKACRPLKVHITSGPTVHEVKLAQSRRRKRLVGPFYSFLQQRKQRKEALRQRRALSKKLRKQEKMTQTVQVPAPEPRSAKLTKGQRRQLRIRTAIEGIIKAVIDGTVDEVDPIKRRESCIWLAQQRLPALPNDIKADIIGRFEQSDWHCFNFEPRAELGPLTDP